MPPYPHPEPRTIIQLIPADGWYAVYKDDIGGEISSRLIAWALHDDGSVDGMDDVDNLCHSCNNFDRFEWHG